MLGVVPGREGRDPRSRRVDGLEGLVRLLGSILERAEAGLVELFIGPPLSEWSTSPFGKKRPRTELSRYVMSELHTWFAAVATSRYLDGS